MPIIVVTLIDRRVGNAIIPTRRTQLIMLSWASGNGVIQTSGLLWHLEAQASFLFIIFVCVKAPFAL